MLCLGLGEEPRPGGPLEPGGPRVEGLQGPGEGLDAGHVVVRGGGGRGGQGGRRGVLQGLSDGGQQERPSAFHSVGGQGLVSRR